MIGIIGAMQVEIEGLVGRVKNSQEVCVGELVFVRGDISQQAVVICRCGIGKVNAAMAAAVMVSRFGGINLIINLGVAGGLHNTLKQGDFVIGANSIQHDFDLTVEGLKAGQLSGREQREFLSCQHSVKKMSAVLKKLGYSYTTGTIVSGDQFIACNKKTAWLTKEFAAAACDMESAAIAHVCTTLQIPFLAIRAISDGASDNAFLDFASFVEVAASRSIRAVEEFLSAYYN